MFSDGAKVMLCFFRDSNVGLFKNMFLHQYPYPNLLSGSKDACGQNDHDCTVYFWLVQQWMISTEICFDTIIITFSVAVMDAEDKNMWQEWRQKRVAELHA